MPEEVNEKLKNIVVSVVIPVFNEEKYIKNLLESLIFQDYCKENLEIILADGMSSDKTREIIKLYTQKYDYIKLVNNHKKTVQHGLNIGINNAVGKYIVRMDAHSEYEKNYISKCIEYLENTDATNVGGPMVAVGKTRLQKIIATAYHSEFALGGGKNHDKNYQGYTDTVFLGAFRKQDILKLNLYDVNLTKNEDDDLCYRMIKNNMKIYITPEIKSKYYPRDNFKDLFRQYYDYGLWKIAVIKKHRRPARITHLVPALFVVFLVLFGIFSVFSKIVFSVFCTIMSLYLILNIYFSFRKNELNFYDKFILMWVHFILHVSYGLGFIAGVFKFRNINF